MPELKITEPYRLVNGMIGVNGVNGVNGMKGLNGLMHSKDTVEALALKYDVGTIRSEKYGEATVSGHFLFLSDKEFPPVPMKQLEEKVRIWMNAMGLKDNTEELFEKQIDLLTLIAQNASGIDAEKLEPYFTFHVFGTFYDNTIRKLSHLNENNPQKQQEDLSRLIENLISIIENRGDMQATKVAASKLHPLFKPTCFVLAYVCKCSFEQMDEDDYERFMREAEYFIRSVRWLQEYETLPFEESEYLTVRVFDLIASPMICLVCIAKGVRVSDEIRRHPVFRRYFENVIKHANVVNDILSLAKEIADDDSMNTILFDCRTNSLQTAIKNAEKKANDLIIALWKDQIRLKLYYPTNKGLRNFIEVIEHIVDGSFRWYQTCARYGNRKIETCIVEYSCDYNIWLEKLATISVENMKEPGSASEGDNRSVPSLFV